MSMKTSHYNFIIFLKDSYINFKSLCKNLLMQSVLCFLFERNPSLSVRLWWGTALTTTVYIPANTNIWIIDIESVSKLERINLLVMWFQTNAE